MKLALLNLWLLPAALAFAQPAVTNLPANPREVLTVPVGTDRVSLIRFPSPISHLEGAFLATDSEPPARFQVNFTPGRAYFSVRALQANATASVTVIWKQQPFVFNLVASPTPLQALNLVEPVARDVRLAGGGPSAHRLLGILDTAKAYSLLQAQHPAEVADVVRRACTDRWDYRTYELWLEEIFHFKTEDTPVFRVVFHNQQSQPLTYLPQSFRIEVGRQIYFAAIADGDGFVPPGGRSPVYFAVSSAPDGSRPGLSINNAFNIMFTTPTTTPPAGKTR